MSLQIELDALRVSYCYCYLLIIIIVIYLSLFTYYFYYNFHYCLFMEENEHTNKCKIHSYKLKHKTILHKHKNPNIHTHTQTHQEKYEENHRSTTKQIHNLQAQLQQLQMTTEQQSHVIRSLEQTNDDLERAKRVALGSLEDFESKLNQVR